MRPLARGLTNLSPLYQPRDQECPGGGTGRRAGLKIQYLRMCRFDSDPGHQFSVETRSSGQDERRNIQGFEAAKVSGSVSAAFSVQPSMVRVL